MIFSQLLSERGSKQSIADFDVPCVEQTDLKMKVFKTVMSITPSSHRFIIRLIREKKKDGS